MDFSTVAGLISSVGFPIFACVYLAWNQRDQDARYREDLTKMRETVENNTKIMVKICEKLDVEEEKNR